MLKFHSTSQQGPSDRSENPMQQYLSRKQLRNLVVFIALLVVSAALLYNLGNSTLKWIAVTLVFTACLALTIGVRWMYYYNQRHAKDPQTNDSDDLI